MNDILSYLFLSFGVLWVLIAGYGLLKFNNFFYKVHIVGKGPSLGIFLILIGVCLHFGDLTTLIKCLTIFAFVFYTVPVGSSLLGLSEYNRLGHDPEKIRRTTKK